MSEMNEVAGASLIPFRIRSSWQSYVCRIEGSGSSCYGTYQRFNTPGADTIPEKEESHQ